MGKSQKFILFMGFFMIAIITVCTFFKGSIEYIIITKNIEHLYGDTEENKYFLEDNFEYVNNYDKAILNSKQDIIDSVYYLLNSGITYSERYCAKEYTNCYNDVNEISSDAVLLTNLNNYVHPYNSFDNIEFSFDEEVVRITINHIYTEEDIKVLDTLVDNIINSQIVNTMSTREKIKTIHDYIINSTDYDELKIENRKDSTYRSNTAYGVLVQEYGICSGYSDTMAIFLDKLNIINYKISNDEHIWNLVYLDGEWLHLDLTWDDPISDENITRDNYFLITSDNLKSLEDNVHNYDTSVFKEVA